MRGIQNEKKTKHLPNVIQSNKLEPNWTFQNNHGILLGVKLAIQIVSWSLYRGLTERRSFAVCDSFYHKLTHPIYGHFPSKKAGVFPSRTPALYSLVTTHPLRYQFFEQSFKSIYIRYCLRI